MLVTPRVLKLPSALWRVRLHRRLVRQNERIGEGIHCKFASITSPPVGSTSWLLTRSNADP